MIIIKISGGLGNQLFQYAAGRNLSLETGAEFKLDIFSFKDEKLYREYSLHRFNIIEHIASREEVARLKKYKLRKGRAWLWYNHFIANKHRYFQEKRFDFDPDILKIHPPVYLDGYWQTEKYFTKHADTIRRELMVKTAIEGKNKEVYDLMRSTKSVAVHIRRTDYVTNPQINEVQGLCGIDYYKEAGRKIAEEIGTPNFFVFSDDPQWTAQNITFPYPTIYVNHNGVEKDYEDLRLMSSAEHQIIANSSFSWWGAWLNTNKGKIVIAPKKWFAIDKYDTRDIIPESWIKI